MNYKILTDSLTKLNYEVIIKAFKENDENEYVIKYRRELLPDWQENPQTIIFLFFQCKCTLDGTNLQEEQIEKDRLLVKFNYIGNQLYNVSKKQRILTEAICPKSGYPLYSTKGRQFFSIQHLVSRYLPEFTIKSKICGLIHPIWGQAVYPCIILSNAQPTEVKLIIEKLIFS